VTAQKSPLKSLEFITLRIKDAVCDRFRTALGSRPSIEKARPEVRVHAFLEPNRGTLYLDTSGEPLFKRGWRKSAVEAPLRSVSERKPKSPRPAPPSTSSLHTTGPASRSTSYIG